MRILLFSLLIISIPAFSQCDGKPFPTLGVFYTKQFSQQGIGLAIGYTGDNDPFDLHSGYIYYLPQQQTGKEKTKSYGKLITSAGLRFYRNEYELSLYACGIISMDLPNGIEPGAGIKALWPVKNIAFFLEPDYMSISKFSIKTGVYFIVR